MRRLQLKQQEQQQQVRLQQQQQQVLQEQQQHHAAFIAVFSFGPQPEADEGKRTLECPDIWG